MFKLETINIHFNLSMGCEDSRGVPVNDPRYSVNEGCFSDLLHTLRRLRSS